MAAHEAELMDLSEKLDADRARKQLALRDHLTDKRKRKMAGLRRRQDAELVQESLQQSQELSELKTKQVPTPAAAITH